MFRPALVCLLPAILFFIRFFGTIKVRIASISDIWVPTSEVRILTVI